MTARLVAIDEGPDILLDRAMVVVGRHPACDARLDSLRVSRHHCCMVQESGEVVVRDLGSTNGIRINGQRVEMGRLKPGDELSIAHIRYRFDHGQGPDQTLADPVGTAVSTHGFLAGSPSRSGNHNHEVDGFSPDRLPLSPLQANENALAAAVRKILPSAVAEKCRIQVIVQMSNDKDGNGEAPVPTSGAPSSENHAE
jgi:FHA domain